MDDIVSSPLKRLLVKVFDVVTELMGSAIFVKPHQQVCGAGLVCATHPNRPRH